MTITECAEFLRAHDNFLLLTHVRPDGDTLCSAAALCSALRRMGKCAGMLENPGVTAKYFSFIEKYIVSDNGDDCCTVSIDTASPNMLTAGFTPQRQVLLAIDHHGSNSGYAENTLVMSEMAACGEIVMRLIEELHGFLTKEEAELLYCALSTDCGCFCYGNTTPQTLRDAAHLIEYGVNNGYYNKLLFRSFSFSRLKLEGLIFSSLRSYCDHRINVAVITLEMLQQAGATENDCDDLASLAGKVEGSVAAITIREMPDGRSKASVRTDETVNASEICAVFGGGGHAMAAGCTAEMGPFELAERLVDITKGYLK